MSQIDNSSSWSYESGVSTVVHKLPFLRCTMACQLVNAQRVNNESISPCLFCFILSAQSLILSFFSFIYLPTLDRIACRCTMEKKPNICAYIHNFYIPLSIQKVIQMLIYSFWSHVIKVSNRFICVFTA